MPWIEALQAARQAHSELQYLRAEELLRFALSDAEKNASTAIGAEAELLVSRWPDPLVPKLLGDQLSRLAITLEELCWLYGSVADFDAKESTAKRLLEIHEAHLDENNQALGRFIPERSDLETSLPELADIHRSTVFRVHWNHHAFLQSFIAFLEAHRGSARANQLREASAQFFREARQWQERLSLEPPSEEERLATARTEAKSRYWEHKREAESVPRQISRNA